MFFFLSLFLGYLIGSLPTAFLLVKWTSKRDIRTLGTGNVGAMNTYDVTKSKAVSIAVLLIDIFKGACAVWLSTVFFSAGFWMPALAGCGAILGHNYSPWLKFKGGRGLATATGVMVVMGWFLVVIWCGAWVLTYLPSKNIHLGNVVACIVLPIVVALLPESFLERMAASYEGFTQYMIFVLVVSFVLLLSHRQPIIELWNTYIKTSTAG